MTQLIHCLQGIGGGENGREEQLLAANHHQKPKCSHIPYLDKCPVLRLKDMNIFRQLKDTEGTKTVTERSVPL